MRELSVPSPLRCDVSVSSLNTYTTGADMPTRAPIYLFIFTRPVVAVPVAVFSILRVPPLPLSAPRLPTLFSLFRGPAALAPLE